MPIAKTVLYAELLYDEGDAHYYFEGAARTAGHMLRIVDVRVVGFLPA
jgi:hypothetical protein